jgi:hypothetical protein
MWLFNDKFQRALVKFEEIKVGRITKATSLDYSGPSGRQFIAARASFSAYSAISRVDA